MTLPCCVIWNLFLVFQGSAFWCSSDTFLGRKGNALTPRGEPLAEALHLAQVGKDRLSSGQYVLRRHSKAVFMCSASKAGWLAEASGMVICVVPFQDRENEQLAVSAMDHRVRSRRAC